MKFIFEQGGNFEFHSNLLVMDFVLSLFLSLLMSSAIYLNDKIFENVKEGDQRNTTSYDFAAFYEEPSISRFIDTVYGFYLGEDNDDEDGNELPPFRWNYLPLPDIDPLLRYNIGWQPEEQLLLHSKKVFENSHSVMWQMSQAQKGKQNHQQQVGIRAKD